MGNKARIEELEAMVEHLQDRVDRLRDHIYEHPSGEYVWNKFEDTMAWARKYDKNSKMYKILNDSAAELLEFYMNILLPYKP